MMNDRVQDRFRGTAGGTSTPWVVAITFSVERRNIDEAKRWQICRRPTSPSNCWTNGMAVCCAPMERLKVLNAYYEGGMRLRSQMHCPSAHP